MEKERLFRVATIVYADESQILSPRAIHNKIIQSVFVINNNKGLPIHSIIDCIKSEYNLDFIEEEILEIIKKDKSLSYNTSTHHGSDNTIFNLSTKRYQYLIEKTNARDLKNFINKFVKTEYKGNLKPNIIEETIYKFLYEVLNKNILVHHFINVSTIVKELIN